MTDYSGIWKELEHACVTGDAGNLRYKEAVSVTPYIIFCCLDHDTGKRGIIIRFPDNGKKYPLPHASRGFQIHFTTGLTRESGYLDMLIFINGSEYNDIFTTFSNDLLHTLVKLKKCDDFIEFTLKHLKKWQDFMEKLADTCLTPNQCRGLYGELYFMYKYLFPQIGARAAVAAWHGPMKKQQDFLLENSTGVEVKTTTGKSSDTLTISSEYQLDPTGFSSLYLYHLELVDLRDNTNTLNSLVDLIRTGCNDDPEALMDFSRKLVMSNYRQKDLEHYGSTSYAIRKESAYHVSDEFPCITGNDLKNGITNVKYSLSTAAIEQYTVEISDLIKCLKEGYM